MRLLLGFLVSLLFLSFSACNEEVEAEKLAELYNELDMYSIGKRDSVFPNRIEQIKQETDSEAMQDLMKCFQFCIEIADSYDDPKVIDKNHEQFLKILTSPAYKTYPFIIQYVIYSLFADFGLLTRPREEYLIHVFYCLKMLKEADEEHGYFLARTHQIVAYQSVYYDLPFGFREDNVQLGLKALGDKKEKYAVLASDLYYKIAQSYISQKKYEEALPNLNKAIEIIDTLNNEFRDVTYFPEKIYLFGKMKLYEQMENEKTMLFNSMKETNYSKKLKKIIQLKTAYFYCLGDTLRAPDEFLLNMDYKDVVDCAYDNGPDQLILFYYNRLLKCIYKSENRHAELKQYYVNAIDYTERCLKYTEKNHDLSIYFKEFIPILETDKNEEWLRYSNKFVPLELEKIRKNNYYISHIPLLLNYKMDKPQRNTGWQSFPWFWLLLNVVLFLFLIWGFIQFLRLKFSTSTLKQDSLKFSAQVEQLVVSESLLFEQRQQLEHRILSFQRIASKHFKYNAYLEAHEGSASYNNIYSKLKNNFDRLLSFRK